MQPEHVAAIGFAITKVVCRRAMSLLRVVQGTTGTSHLKSGSDNILATKTDNEQKRSKGNNAVSRESEALRRHHP